MAEITIDQRALDNAIKGAIASTVAANLSPDAFSVFVHGVLNGKDRYSSSSVFDSVIIDAMKEHLKPIIEEWISHNEEILRQQVFQKMETELGPAIGDKIVASLLASFNLQRTR